MKKTVVCTECGSKQNSNTALINKMDLLTDLEEKNLKALTELQKEKDEKKYLMELHDLEKKEVMKDQREEKDQRVKKVQRVKKDQQDKEDQQEKKEQTKRGGSKRDD